MSNPSSDQDAPPHQQVTSRDRSLFPELTDAELADAMRAAQQTTIQSITNNNEALVNGPMDELLESHLKMLNDQQCLLTEEEATRMASKMAEDMQKIDPVTMEERKCQMCGCATLRGVPPRICSQICEKAFEEKNIN